MNDDLAIRNARRHVEALRGFYIHAAIYVAVSLLLLFINYMTDPTWWAQWPVLGWGAGVAGHAFVVFSNFSILGREWEERKIKEHMERERAKSTGTT